MFSQLLHYNWKVFKSKVSLAQAILIAAYALLIGILFINYLGTAFLLAVFTKNPAYTATFSWLTPDIATMILLIFANGLWASQIFLTSVKQINIEENKKLLSLGYSVKKLSGHLNIISFFHPVNIGYTILWLVFLITLSNSLLDLPLILIAVLLNYCLIISLKYRFIKVIQKYFKWILSALFVFLLILIFVLPYIDVYALFKNSGITVTLASFNQFLSSGPGGLIYAAGTSSLNIAYTIILTAIGAFAIAMLKRDQLTKTKELLLKPWATNYDTGKKSSWPWYQKWLGNTSGKYFYYILQHPYSRVQLLISVFLPALYLIPIVTQGDPSFTLITVFLMIIPISYKVYWLANIYGFEHREFLLMMQFPVPLSKQINDRIKSGIYFALNACIIVTGLGIFVFHEPIEILRILVGNTFMFLVFIHLALWNTYKNLKKVSWNYSFSSMDHPVIPQSVSFIMMIVIFVLGVITFYPIEMLRWYKEGIFLILSIVLCFALIKKLKRQEQQYKAQILPQLWTNL